MFIKLVRYFHSYVSIYIRSGDVSKVLNTLAKNDLYFWIKSNLDDGVMLCVFKEDFLDAKELITKSNGEIISFKNIGVRFYIKSFKLKIILFCSFFLVLFMYVCLHFCILTIDIKGSSSVKNEDILYTLNTLGIKPFTYAPNLNTLILQEEMLLKIPKLSFIAINKKGWNLEVIVSDRVLHEQLNEKTPCNIIASDSGVIRYIKPLYGKVMVEKNSIVKKGDLLVSGVIETEFLDTYLVHSNAEIYADIEVSKTYMIDLDKTGKEYYEFNVEKPYLNIFNFKIPLFFSLYNDGNYTYKEEDSEVQLFNVKMPFMITTQYRDYYKQGARLTKTDAKMLLEKQMKIYESVELADCSILSKRNEYEQKGNKIYLTTHYTVQRNIAQKVKITEEKDNIK